MTTLTFGPALLAIGDGTAQRGCLRIANGRIEGWEDASSRADHPLPVDSIVTRGLIDLHTNGTGSLWFNREPVEAVEATAAECPKHGVTAFLPSVMTGPWDRMLRAAGAISNNLQVGAGRARPLGVHFEGPFLSGEYHRVHPREYLLTPTPSRVEALLDSWKGGR